MRRWLLCAVLGWATGASAGDVRLLLAIGSDVGDPGDALLQYAAEDARRVVDVFTELGQVDADRAVLLANPSDVQVREALFELGGRAAELKAAGHTVTLVLYISGHARAGVLHLKGTSLSLVDVRRLAARGHAQLTVLIVDACEAGAIARTKGGSRGTDFDVKVDSTSFVGTVAITSSGSQEASEEWDSLKGSLFTHHFIGGLRGNADLNRDERVSLMEAYAYAFRQTTAGSVTGAQHPSLDLDLVGAGELTLTELSRGQGTLIFPMGLEGRFRVVRMPQSDLVLEVQKAAGAETRLAVPRGRFQISKRTGTTVAVSEVDLPFGGTGMVDAKRFSLHHFAEVSLKGGTLELRQHWLGPSFEVATEPLAATFSRWTAGLSYRVALDQWVLLVGLGYGYSEYRGVDLLTLEHHGLLKVAFGYRVVTRYVMPVVALVVEGTLREQAYRRDQEDLLRSIGFASVPTRWSVGLSGGLLLGLEIPLPAWFQAMPWVTGQVRAPSGAGAAWSVGAAGGLALGGRF